MRFTGDWAVPLVEGVAGALSYRWLERQGHDVERLRTGAARVLGREALAGTPQSATSRTVMIGTALDQALARDGRALAVLRHVVATHWGRRLPALDVMRALSEAGVAFRGGEL